MAQKDVVDMDIPDYESMDTDTFHSTLVAAVSGWRDAHEESNRLCKMAGLAYYRLVRPGVDDARRRLAAGEKVGGFTGIEKYIEEGLGINPATYRQWTKRDLDRQIEEEIKQLVGVTTVIGVHGDTHPLTAVQQDVVDALAGQGWKNKDCETAVRDVLAVAGDSDFDAIWKAVMATHPSAQQQPPQPATSTVIDVDDSDVDGAAIKDGDGVVISTPLKLWEAIDRQFGSALDETFMDVPDATFQRRVQQFAQLLADAFVPSGKKVIIEVKLVDAE
jgi:hypothetical protein